MDLNHIEELSNTVKELNSSSKVLLLGSYNPNQNDTIIYDPFFGTKDAFEKCYQQISISCEKFLDKLIDEKFVN